MREMLLLTLAAAIGLGTPHLATAQDFDLQTEAGDTEVLLLGQFLLEPEVVDGAAFSLVNVDPLELQADSPYDLTPGPVLGEDFTWRLAVDLGDPIVVEIDFRELSGTVDPTGFTWDSGRTDIFQLLEPDDPDNSPREFVDSVPITPEAAFRFDFDMESGAGYPGTTTATGELSGMLEVLGFAADINVAEFTAVFAPQQALEVSTYMAPRARGSSIDVVILGSDSLDVEDVDVPTLELGPDAASPYRNRSKVRDFTGDGHPDLLTRYRLSETGIPAGSLEACLRGEVAGQSFETCDRIVTSRVPVLRPRGRR